MDKQHDKIKWKMERKLKNLHRQKFALEEKIRLLEKQIADYKEPKPIKGRRTTWGVDNMFYSNNRRRG